MKTHASEHIHREVSANLSALMVATFTHWQIANSMLPEEFPIVLFSNTTLEAAKSLAGTLKPLGEEATELLVASELVTGALREKQRALREWLRFYSRGIRGNAPGTRWERLLEPLPHEKGAPLLTGNTARETVVFWANLEMSPPMGWPGPMVRMDGTGLAEFRAEVRAFFDAMADDMEARIAAELAAEFVGWTRDQLA